MKVIKYFGVGTVPNSKWEKGKRKRINLKYAEWIKETVEHFKELGVPSKPFKRIFKIKMEITHSQWVRQCDNLQSEVIYDALREAGIIEDSCFRNVRSLELTPKYSYMNGAFIVTLFIEEEDKKNEGISYDEITLCEDLEITKLYPFGHTIT